MLTAYRADPAAYAREHAGDIAKHPWLADPSGWMSKVPAAYRDALNEQTILNVDGRRENISHGDPHTGNIFVDIDPHSHEPKITFIDTGLVVRRSSEEMAKHAGIMLSILTGNSKKIARSLVEMSEEPMSHETKLAKQNWIEKELDTRLFKARVDVTNSKFNSSFMDHLIEEMQIRLSERDLSFAKSQFQTIGTYDDLTKIAAGKRSSFLKDSLADMGLGASKLLWHKPLTTASEFYPSVRHYVANPADATRTALQFLVPRGKPQPS